MFDGVEVRRGGGANVCCGRCPRSDILGEGVDREGGGRCPGGGANVPPSDGPDPYPTLPYLYVLFLEERKKNTLTFLSMSMMSDSLPKSVIEASSVPAFARHSDCASTASKNAGD